MDFIAGLMFDPNKASENRWNEILAGSGRSALSETSKNGSVRFDILLTGDPASDSPDQTAISKASLLRGICFSNESDIRVEAAKILNDRFVEKVRDSRGAHFSNEFWGHYVGLFFDPEVGDLTAIRDPNGGRSLYYARLCEFDLYLFSNSLPTLCRTIGGKLDVDRKMIVLSVAYMNSLPTRRTGFKDITSLLPGECMHIEAKTRKVVSDLPWWRKIASHPRSDRNLASAVEAVTQAWSSVHGKIALQLSGGLDSSGLLGMMAKLGRTEQIRCLSSYRSSGVTDERYYARVAASHVGVELTEFDIEGLRYPLTLSAAYKYSARPHAKVLFTQLDEAFDAHALSAGCETYWLGFGGDTLFMNTPKSSLVIDALRLSGPSAAFRRAIEIALYEEKSLWRVMWEAGTKSWDRRLLHWAKCMRSPWDAGDETLDDLDSIGFRLIEDCFSQVSMPGQRSRLYDVYYEMWATTEMRPFFTAGGMKYGSPYYSEPVIESAAGIPSYEMVNFGLNRFPQREFVGTVMPQEIAGRISKGGADDQVIRSLLADADQIEDLLANGHLASLGLASADRAKIDRDNIAAEAFKNFNIVNMLASEVWLSGHSDILRI